MWEFVFKCTCVSASVFYVEMKRLDAHTLCSLKASTLCAVVPELTGLAVHSRQQQSGSLPDIITVHWEAASVFSVDHSHTHPLHQGWQHHKRPVGGDRSTCSGHQRLTLDFSNTQYLVCPGICKEDPLHPEFAYVILVILPSVTDVWEQSELQLEDGIKDSKWCEKIKTEQDHNMDSRS